MAVSNSDGSIRPSSVAVYCGASNGNKPEYARDATGRSWIISIPIPRIL